jgi:hypothetical protein
MRALQYESRVYYMRLNILHAGHQKVGRREVPASERLGDLGVEWKFIFYLPAAPSA